MRIQYITVVITNTYRKPGIVRELKAEYVLPRPGQAQEKEIGNRSGRLTGSPRPGSPVRFCSCLPLIWTRMRRSRFTGQQIVAALRQVESGTPVVQVCRKLGNTAQTCSRWKCVVANTVVAELRRLGEVEEENRRLKQLVADLTVDKRLLQEVLRNNG